MFTHPSIHVLASALALVVDAEREHVTLVAKHHGVYLARDT